MTQEQQIFIATLHFVTSWAVRNGKSPIDIPEDVLKQYKEDAELLCKVYNLL